MDGVLDLPDDEVERDRMEGDFTRARMLRIWCFCSKPRCVCMVTRPVVARPDGDARNPRFAFLDVLVPLPLQFLAADNPRVSV
eukprot:COSAG06_NODE_32265_length_509_cov_0.536585_1_plen_82_part_01